MARKIASSKESVRGIVVSANDNFTQNMSIYKKNNRNIFVILIKLNQMTNYLATYSRASFVFLSCLASASIIRCVSKSVYATPDAAINLGYILIVVKPGIVLTSLK